MSFQSLLDSIPFVAKTGIHCDDYAPGHVVLSLSPDRSNLTHAGTVHPGALFTLAETAAAAACATHPELSGYQMLALSFNVRYQNAASGRVRARCHITGEMARTVSWGVTTTGRAELEVPISVEGPGGEEVAECSAAWRFLRRRSG